MLWLRNRRQASNLRLPNSRSGALSLLSYSAFGFVLLSDNPQRAAHRNVLVRKPGFAPGPFASRAKMLLLHHNPAGIYDSRLTIYALRVARSPIENRKSEIVGASGRTRTDD